MISDDSIAAIDITDTCLQFILDGEVDLVSVPPMGDRVEEVLSATDRPLVVFDLRSVHFIDSAGLAYLVDMHRLPTVAGKLKVVVMPESQPERVLRLGRFDTVLDVISQENKLEECSGVGTNAATDVHGTMIATDQTPVQN